MSENCVYSEFRRKDNSFKVHSHDLLTFYGREYVESSYSLTINCNRMILWYTYWIYNPLFVLYFNLFERLHGLEESEWVYRKAYYSSLYTDSESASIYQCLKTLSIFKYTFNIDDCIVFLYFKTFLISKTLSFWVVVSQYFNNTSLRNY